MVWRLIYACDIKPDKFSAMSSMGRICTKVREGLNTSTDNFFKLLDSEVGLINTRQVPAHSVDLDCLHVLLVIGRLQLIPTPSIRNCVIPRLDMRPILMAILPLIRGHTRYMQQPPRPAAEWVFGSGLHRVFRSLFSFGR